MFDAFKVFRRDLQVLRRAKGDYKSGQWQDGKESIFNITASVQGTNAEILQTLPEGSRVDASHTIRTSTKLRTSEAGGITPDIVLIDNKKFIVIRVTPHQNLSSTKHYEVVVVGENIDAD